MMLQNEYEDKSNEILLLEYKKTKDLKIKQELTMRYVYIVRSIAIQMRDVYLSFAQIDDIINEGVLAIMTAIDKFDLDKNVKFETYISKRIRGLVIDIARRQDWIPRSIRKNVKDIDNATNELYNQYGRFPTDAEIAKHLNISIEKYQEDLGKTNLFNVLSLDMYMEEAQESKRAKQLPIADLDELPEQYLLNNEFKMILRKGIESLRDNEQMVISLYYEKEMSMKEIAHVMQVSEPRISQIHANAIRKMRVYMDKFINDGM